MLEQRKLKLTVHSWQNMNPTPAGLCCPSLGQRKTPLSLGSQRFLLGCLLPFLDFACFYPPHVLNECRDPGLRPGPKLSTGGGPQHNSACHSKPVILGSPVLPNEALGGLNEVRDGKVLSEELTGKGLFLSLAAGSPGISK